MDFHKMWLEYKLGVYIQMTLTAFIRALNSGPWYYCYGLLFPDTLNNISFYVNWMYLILQQCFGSDWGLLQIPFGGAVSEDQALLSLPCGEVPGLPGPDPADPPAGLPLPRLLHPTGLLNRRVLLWPADRNPEEQQHGAGRCPVQARSSGRLQAAQLHQPGGVRASRSAGGVRCSGPGTPELRLPPALWDSAWVRCFGCGHAILQRPQYLSAVPAGEPEWTQIL